MATKFLEPGGDSTFNVATTTGGGFWSSIIGSPVIATDFVHGSHIKSISFPTGGNIVRTGSIITNAGARFSYYIYIVTLPGANTRLAQFENSGAGGRISINLSSSGVLSFQIAGSPVGSGSTLSTGVWYRLSVAFTATSTTVNEMRLYKDGVLDVSLSNQVLTGTDMVVVSFGNNSSDGSFDHRSSDHYVDNSTTLTDPGNIWVTAKRPNANGTANNFSTQIGAGGSGYGTGHSPQVNERALSTTNGWSVVAVGATTEEYNIESVSTGDIDITGATIVDYIGWVYGKSLTSETASIRVNNTDSNISLTSTSTMFTAVKGSTTYPAGTGTDIGIVTDATATTVSLYECGVIVAYIPVVTPLSPLQIVLRHVY